MSQKDISVFQGEEGPSGTEDGTMYETTLLGPDLTLKINGVLGSCDKLDLLTGVVGTKNTNLL